MIINFKIIIYINSEPNDDDVNEWIKFSLQITDVREKHNTAGITFVRSLRSKQKVIAEWPFSRPFHLYPPLQQEDRNLCGDRASSDQTTWSHY